MLRFLFTLPALVAMAGAACAEPASDSLIFGHAWSRPTAEGMPTGVAYLSITNRGPKEETLIGARTPAAARVEFHRTSIDQGMARMRPAGELLIAPNATLTAAPGGLHLMLVDLKAPLEVGETIPLILQFKVAGIVTVLLHVEREGVTHE
ncbi:MAG: copper chaperone PCu(A)C [Pseudomonadota bacterium]